MTEARPTSRWVEAATVVAAIASLGALAATTFVALDRDRRLVALEREIAALRDTLAPEPDDARSDVAPRAEGPRAPSSLTADDLEAIAELCSVAASSASAPNADSATAADPALEADRAIAREEAEELVDAASMRGAWTAADRDALRRVMGRLSQEALDATVQRVARLLNDGTLSAEAFPPI